MPDCKFCFGKTRYSFNAQTQISIDGILRDAAIPICFCPCCGKKLPALEDDRLEQSVGEGELLAYASSYKPETQEDVFEKVETENLNFLLRKTIRNGQSITEWYDFQRKQWIPKTAPV